MPLSQDLLEQAQFLVGREPGKPKQASLRRAVSTAYYAIFHLLAWDAAAQATPSKPVGLTGRVVRSIEHGAMKKAAQLFETGNLPDAIKPLVTHPIPPYLLALAHNLVLLQEERHAADYDRTRAFKRARAQNAVSLAEQTLATWNSVKETDHARLFMALLLFPKLGSR